MLSKCIKLVLISMLVAINIQAQWKTGSGGNKFDGEYKFAKVIGKGGEWPNNKPILTINKFNTSEPNIYLADIGYTGCSYGKISIAFDDTDEILDFYSTPNKSNDAAFFSGSIEEMSELLELFKQKSKVYVRYSNNCGQEDYQFGLAGSQNAIKYVVGDYYKNRLIEIQNELQNELEEKEARKLLSDSLKRERDRVKALNEAIELENKIKKFEDKLLHDFDFESLEKTKEEPIAVASFRMPFDKEINFCKKYKVYIKEPPLENGKAKFYHGKRYTFYNQIKDGCIRIDELSTNRKSLAIYYISKSELNKLGDDYQVTALLRNWDELIKPISD